jgi:hypothetical protein
MSTFPRRLSVISLALFVAGCENPLCKNPAQKKAEAILNESSSEFVELAKKVRGNAAGSYTLAATYLDGAAGRGFPDEIAAGTEAFEVLRNLQDLSPLGMNQPYWQRMQTLDNYQHLAGFLAASDHTTLYLRGERSHAVQIYNNGRIRLLSDEARMAEYRNHCLREMAAYRNGDMLLFDVSKTVNGHRIWIDGEAITVTPLEYDAIKGGRRLPASHPLTRAIDKRNSTALVLYSNPLMQKAGPPLREADDFAFALQKAYVDVPVYRDPLSAKTGALVQSLNSFNAASPDDIVAVVADESFQPRPTDYNIIQDLKRQLTAARIRIATYSDILRNGWTMGRGKGLIVITAHSSEELAGFVRDLGSKGVFEGNYVLFNSCETPLTRALVTEINTRYKAVATFAHDTKEKYS